MKLPNNFGTIYKLTGNRRRPYVVKKFIDKKQKPIGYFENYTQALTFLIAYNKEPNFYGQKITFAEIYSCYRDEHWPDISDSGRSGYENSYRQCSKLYDIPFNTIKLNDLQAVIKAANGGYSTQKKIRTLFHMMYRYAMKHDFIEKDYSQFLTVCKDTKRKERVPFTIRQIRKLAKIETPAAEIVLMLIYTGLRPSEFLRLKCSNDINWKQNYLIVRKSKTKAGLRIIPLHRSIIPLFEKRKDNTFLIGGDNNVAYSSFRTMFKTLMEQVHMKHVPYETRHTTASMLNTYGANIVATKMLLGHSRGNSVTEKVYTHKRLPELKKAINLIPPCA